MVTDYAREIMSRASGRNYIFPIFFPKSGYFSLLFALLFGTTSPYFSLRFAGKPVEALYIWLTRRWSYITVEMKAMQAKSVKLAIWSLQALPSNNVMLCTEMALGKNLGILTN